MKRNAFFPGQQLMAEDLTDLNRANRELRWLHNRALHNWGIGIGLEVKGQRGDSVVSIAPGFAIDCLGREVILAAAQTKTVPAVANQNGLDATFYLVLAYKDDADQQVLERRPGVCQPQGAVRLGEEPVLAWRLLNELKEGLDIVLAKASIRDCRLSLPLSLAERRNARPSQQPYIYCGQTGANDTPWQEWLANGVRLGVFVDVDTSAAQFHKPPAYAAHIIGERVSLGPPFSLVSFASVANATPNRFMLQALLPSFGSKVKGVNPSLATADLLMALKTLNWHVSWIGVEA
jgi:hypothetical protein